MSSPTTEVKPSQVAQLTAEIEELKKDNSRMYKACDNIHNLVGKDIVSVKKERDKYYIKWMNSSIGFAKLKEENEELKEQVQNLLDVLGWEIDENGKYIKS